MSDRCLWLTETGEGYSPPMDQSVVHRVHMAINLAHRLVYFVPEAGEEYDALGVTGAGAYFASRSAPMGAVSDHVVLATFYNFSPLAVLSTMPGVWTAASPTRGRRPGSVLSSVRCSESASTCPLNRSPRPVR